MEMSCWIHCGSPNGYDYFTQDVFCSCARRMEMSCWIHCGSPNGYDYFTQDVFCSCVRRIRVWVGDGMQLFSHPIHGTELAGFRNAAVRGWSPGTMREWLSRHYRQVEGG